MEFFRKIKNTVKNSIKSVVLNYKEFIGLYISVMIVQLLLGTWALSSFTNYYANDRMFDQAYGHDITVTGTNYTVTSIANRLRYDVMSEDASFKSFDVVGNSVGVTLKSGQFDRFYDEYLKRLDDASEIQYTLTPKYVYHTEIQGNIILSSVLIGVVSLLVSILILSVLYSVRTNHYKFQYGIYMTFGADKRMLGGIAMNELLAINLLTLLPSAILSYLLLLIVYAGSTTDILITFPAVLLYVTLSFLVVIVAACTSVGGLFIKPPVSLITTADNSNFVSSPRKSFHLFAKNMPWHYETFTTWRFRKYIARLVCGAVAFSVIFVAGIYCANMLKTENSASNEEFIVYYKPSTKVEDLRERANLEAEDLIEAFYDIEHVERVTFEQSKGFQSRLDHLLILPGTEITGSGFTVPSLYEVDGYNRALNNCRYVSLNETALAMYDTIYDVEYLDGYDAAKLLSDDSMIVISEGLYGAKCFDFEPGDTVVVADMTSIDKEIPPRSKPLDVLKLQINNCSFNYKEFTVGAVIHDTDATDSILIGMNDDTYYATAGDRMAISELSIFVEAGLELSEISDIRAKVSSIMADYEYWSYRVTDDAVFAIVDERINLPGLLYLMSILVLMIAPVVWIFSQVMFYKKREPEFKLLHAMGATMKEICGVHAVSGGLVFAVTLVANYALSTALCYLIYRIFTNVLPQLGIMGMSVSFNSFVPWYVVLIYAGVSALCGCISSMIPFLLYRRKLRLEAKALEEQRIEL